MKRLCVAAALAAVLALAIGAVAYAAQGDPTGNKAPSGPHYNLNIIGVDNPKNNNINLDPTADPNSGKRIFVGLGKNGVSSTKILLQEGPFDVLDYNGTDGQASFQLPNPDTDRDGVTSYSVFVRALGKPGGSAQMQSCYTDATGDWCATDFAGGVEPITIGPHSGRSTFDNVSKDLLYVDYCAAWTLGVCTKVVQVPLFGGEADEYFWQYDNSGLKLAQFRFYEIATDTGWDVPPAPAP